MKSIKPTHWVLILVSAGLIIADIYWAQNGIPGDTISEILLKNALKHPVIPFLFGVIFGHLFWYQEVKE